MRYYTFFILLIIITLFTTQTSKYKISAAESNSPNPNCINEEIRINDPSYNVFSNMGLNSTPLNLVTTNKPIDPSRPNLCGLTGTCPTITSAYTFTPPTGQSTVGWGNSQAVGIQTGNRQAIYVPPSGRNIGNNMQVLISNLNASAGTISLQYTLDAQFATANGTPVNRYDLHLSGLNINSQIISAFNNRNQSNGELPALPAGFLLGNARGSEVIVSMADSGTFMDLQEINDFWVGDTSINPNNLWSYLKYIACLQQPNQIQNTCNQPLVFGDDYSCPFGCLGITATLTGPAAIAANFISSLPIIGDSLARVFFAQIYEIPVSIDANKFKGQILKFSEKHELYGESTTLGYIVGRVDKLSEPIEPNRDNFYYNPNNPNGEEFGENPPTANSSMQNLIIPGEDYIAIANALKNKEEETSEVKILIENTGVGGVGAPPGNYWAEGDLKKIGISVDRDSTCNSGGCWVPRVKVCAPGDGTNCGGGGVAVYVTYDPNGPQNPTAIINRGNITEPLQKKPGEPDQAPVWGFESVTLGNSTVHLSDHAYILPDGSIQHRGHASTAIHYEWCTAGSADACYANFEKINKQVADSDKGGGPIITAQKGLIATRNVQCAYAQSFFAPPGIIYCDETLPGIAKEDRFSKADLALRKEYRQLLKDNEVALNLSEEEKTKRLLTAIKQNHISLMSRAENKGNVFANSPKSNISELITNKQNENILNKLEEKKDKLITQVNRNNTIVEQIAFFTPQSSCPNKIDAQEETICDNESAPKPDTVIYIPPKVIDVICPEGNCENIAGPGETQHTHIGLVKTAGSSGECVDCGDLANTITGSEAIEKANYYIKSIASITTNNGIASTAPIRSQNTTEAKVKFSLGVQQLTQTMLAMLTNTPDETRKHNEYRSGNRPIGINADLNWLSKTYTNFEMSADEWQEYLEGSTVCQRYYRSFNLSPEDKDGQQLLQQNIKGCFDETMSPQNRQNVISENLRPNAGSYYNWTGDYDAKSALPITGKAMYYSKGYGDNMEEIFKNRGYSGTLKDVCPDCDGAGAMLRAGDKQRVVCVKVEDSTSKAYGQTFKVFIVDVAGRNDINVLLNRNWAIDLDYSLGEKMGMVGVGPKNVSISECN